MAILFISDLHLSDERPHTLDLFRRFLEGPARQAEALFILGDLIEVWVGDDDPTPPHPWLLALLRTFTDTGGRLFVMRGNRDLLIGDAFGAATGARLLPDPCTMNLQGRRTLLMHGDLLCTSDHSYQRYRQLVHAPAVQRTFLALPVGLRVGLAHGLRQLTRRLSRSKLPRITDVEAAAVRRYMSKYNVRLLIHGHTHRPGIHDFRLDCKAVRRIVLGDWYEQDSVLVSDEGGERLLRIKDIL